jgi:hypothetical protein
VKTLSHSSLQIQNTPLDKLRPTNHHGDCGNWVHGGCLDFSVVEIHLILGKGGWRSGSGGAVRWTWVGVNQFLESIEETNPRITETIVSKNQNAA